jgi:hypothetical protein
MPGQRPVVAFIRPIPHPERIVLVPWCQPTPLQEGNMPGQRPVEASSRPAPHAECIVLAPWCQWIPLQEGKPPCTVTHTGRGEGLSAAPQVTMWHTWRKLYRLERLAHELQQKSPCRAPCARSTG